jgi:hypothetical protein
MLSIERNGISRMYNLEDREQTEYYIFNKKVKIQHLF